MGWKHTSSDEEEVGKEVASNLKGGKDNAILLISGTENETGYRMRLFCRNPEALAGILHHHAIKTGEIDRALQMVQTLRKIADVAQLLIERDLTNKGLQN